MRTKFLQVTCVLLISVFIFSGCTSQKKTGCVPEKARGGNLKFKGFL